MAGRLHDPLRALLASAGVLSPGEAAPSRDEVVRRLAGAGWSASNITRVLGPDPVTQAEPARESEREPEAKGAPARAVPPRDVSGLAPAAAPPRSLAEPVHLAGKERSTPSASPAPRAAAACASATAAPLPREPRTRIAAWKSREQLEAERTAPAAPPSGTRLALLPAPMPLLPPAPGFRLGSGERRDCARNDECLTVFVRRHRGMAALGHCPADCAAFLEHDAQAARELAMRRTRSNFDT